MPATEAQKCIGCHTRYWQSAKTHLCRQCEREQGIIESLDIRERRERLEQKAIRDEAELKMLERMVEKPVRELVINGMVFEVKWDGSK